MLADIPEFEMKRSPDLSYFAVLFVNWQFFIKKVPIWQLKFGLFPEMHAVFVFSMFATTEDIDALLS
jgi:hypothetical protein